MNQKLQEAILKVISYETGLDIPEVQTLVLSLRNFVLYRCGTNPPLNHLPPILFDDLNMELDAKRKQSQQENQKEGAPK